MQILLPVSLGCVLLASAPAQPAPHPTTSPKAYTGVFTGSVNTFFPLGRSGGLIQFWRRGTDFVAPRVFTATGTRPARGLTAPAVSINTELTLSNTLTTYQTFSSTFAANLGPQTTVVYTRKQLNLPALNAANDPDVPAAWVVHDVPFVYFGPNLLVQFDHGTAVGSVALGRTSDAVPGGAFKHLSAAPSCGGTLTASGSGTLFTLTLAGAAPNAPGALWLGTENVLIGGAPVLPFKLDLIGLVGCYLEVDPILSAPFTADASGAASWNFPINYTATSNPDAIHAQVAHTTTANPLGVATTNATHSVLGGTGLADYVYNYTRDGPTAEFGPGRSDRGGILMFLP